MGRPKSRQVDQSRIRVHCLFFARRFDQQIILTPEKLGKMLSRASLIIRNSLSNNLVRCSSSLGNKSKLSQLEFHSIFDIKFVSIIFSYSSNKTSVRSTLLGVIEAKISNLRQPELQTNRI